MYTDPCSPSLGTRGPHLFSSPRRSTSSKRPPAFFLPRWRPPRIPPSPGARDRPLRPATRGRTSAPKFDVHFIPGDRMGTPEPGEQVQPSEHCSVVPARPLLFWVFGFGSWLVANAAGGGLGAPTGPLLAQGAFGTVQCRSSPEKKNRRYPTAIRRDVRPVEIYTPAASAKKQAMALMTTNSPTPHSAGSGSLAVANRQPCCPDIWTRLFHSVTLRPETTSWSEADGDMNRPSISATASIQRANFGKPESEAPTPAPFFSPSCRLVDDLLGPLFLQVFPP